MMMHQTNVTLLARLTVEFGVRSGYLLVIYFIVYCRIKLIQEIRIRLEISTYRESFVNLIFFRKIVLTSLMSAL